MVRLETTRAVGDRVHTHGSVDDMLLAAAVVDREIKESVYIGVWLGGKLQDVSVTAHNNLACDI